LSSNIVDIAIIGAGPYGLSLAAHLKDGRRSFRIFGQPMRFWRDHMPRGMQLKSDGFASDLFDPKAQFPLQAYCQEKGLPYKHNGLPVKVEVFCDYALEFQKRLVPGLETLEVSHLRRHPHGFELHLSDGTVAHSRQVVVATGIGAFKQMPEVLKNLPGHMISHSMDHSDLSVFKGRKVAVVGGGASAADAAALLGDAGAQPELVARREQLRFHTAPTGRPTPWWRTLRHPPSGLGPGWKSFLCTHLPDVFHAMPEAFRLKAVARHLGPAPGWFVRNRIVGRIPLHTGHQLVDAQTLGEQVQLRLRSLDGQEKCLVVDHVIAATGFQTDLRRLRFLQPELLSGIQAVNHAPVLDRGFQSSVKGLYFVGAVAANSFGPLLRFAYGAGFASRRVAQRLR
jgi:cation diffusion facilitator CzcD-associated flavoprotein CzcO